MAEDQSIAILGAGISGLSTAWALRKRGFQSVTIYEKQSEAGGVIRTVQDGGWQIEKGPNTLLVKDERVWNLLNELELHNRITEPGKEARKRFIIRNRRMHAAPMGLLPFLKTDLFSTRAKFRLLKEPFASRSKQDDETIARFIKRRLGKEVLDYAVNPFVSGIYAGDPEELSLRHTFSSLYTMEQQHGSITKGMFRQKKSSSPSRKALISFDDGLQVLPQTLAAKLDYSFKYGTEVKNLNKSKTGWKLTLKTDGNVQTRSHDTVISTLPAGHLARCLEASELANTLQDLPYAPMSVLGLGFERDQIAHALDGFGMLIPGKEPFSLLGCLFSSSLFPGRAPEGHCLLTCFIGGARHPELAAYSKEELRALILPELDELLGISGDPAFTHHTYWRKAIPQYTIGYDKYLEAMSHLEEKYTNLFLTGNYRHGVSVPDCILNGLDTAGRIADDS